jgi:hypothetical protein
MPRNLNEILRSWIRLYCRSLPPYLVMCLLLQRCHCYTLFLSLWMHCLLLYFCTLPHYLSLFFWSHYIRFLLFSHKFTFPYSSLNLFSLLVFLLYVNLYKLAVFFSLHFAYLMSLSVLVNFLSSLSFLRFLQWAAAAGPQCEYLCWKPQSTMYLEYHSVWPPGTKGGGGDTLACVWGGGGVQIRTTGEKTWHSVYSVLNTLLMNIFKGRRSALRTKECINELHNITK